MQKCYTLVVLLCHTFITGASEVSNFSLDQTRYRRQSEEVKCILPPYPDRGRWKLLKGGAQPGDEISESSVIKYECDSGYKLSAEYAYLVCDEKWNTIRMPECEKRCPPLYSSTTYQLKCSNRRGTQIKCEEATEGTYVEYTCTDFYETPFGYKKALLCTDGRWNQKPVCQPICGKKIVEDKKTLIYGRPPNKKLEYPWVTAIYLKENDTYGYICGGSILSLTVVLTAAHCVTNDYGNVLPKEQYLVGAGKLYSKYQAVEDKHAQYVELSKIIVHKDYKGDSRRFLADIAVLVVKGELAVNDVVQPVCFNNINTIYLHPGSKGEVSGWGKTEAEEVSTVLRTLIIPYKYETTCAQEFPPQWADKFNIVDKICAGFVNQSISVCDGDSGNGLAFKNPEDNRYYIHGIVSLGPLKDDQCDIQQNTLYTKVAFYYEYIDRLLTTYAPIIKDCVLPAHPKNGKWTTENSNLKPGDAVSSSTVLNIECNEGFKLSTSTSSIRCESAHDMPTCLALCPTPSFPSGSDYRCTNRNRQVIDCAEAVDQSKLTYTCPRGYQIPKGTTNNRTCTKGSWGSPQPECIQLIDCGRKGGTNLEYPWTVFLYNKMMYASNKEEFRYICGGTLISLKVVLTGAVCVTDEKGDTLPKENYIIGAGKTHAIYRDLSELFAQYSELSNIISHSGYKGRYRRFLADIAILIAKVPFMPSISLRPICFIGVEFIRLQEGDKGVVLKYDSVSESNPVEVSYKDEATCAQEFPTDFTEKYQLIDKMCAGFENATAGVCTGNSGNGLFFKENDKYYILGIVSISPYSANPKDCHRNTLYTKVSYYYDFINNALSQNY